jgi:hypothetical protein
MRTLLSGMTMVATLAIAGASQAAVGTVDLSWDACSPVVVDKASAAQGVYSLYASELGNDILTKAYEVRVLYADDTQAVPEAWQFNPAGCQGTPLVTMQHLAPASVVKSCPSFQQSTQSLQIKDIAYTPPSDPNPTTTMRIVLANSYPAGATAIGTQRYFLMGVQFDHLFSVVGAGTPGETCGGFEKSICFKLTRAAFIDANGDEVQFSRGNQVVTFNGAAACVAVPARSKTWGQIKGQYRQ